MRRRDEPRCTIRPATAVEAQALSALALRSKGYWGYPAEFLEACRAELTFTGGQIERAGWSLAVAEAGGAVVGFYALERSSPTTFELQALFVEPAFIGRGIGRTLMAHARSAAAAHGADSIVIQSDPNAVGFYEAAGAVLIGTRPSGSVIGRRLPVLSVALEPIGVG